ncbi:MAG: hypothetical protein A2Y12_09545 [Planctomycetes bacterium GWF2_42_9]|nr:MAG: hypothetical protein A2Y12_09545 [Planctomycetes bacterium GWF2_42_9]
MKKLLVVLVLGLASLANAGLFLYQNGAPVDSITMMPGETITLQVYSDNALAWNAYVINGLDGNAAGLLSVPTDLASAGDMKSNSPYVAADGWGHGFLFGTGGSPSGLPVVGVQHTVNFTAGATGTLISLYDGTSYEELDSVSIIVPEPATMVILALGGLLFRRK